MTVTIEPMSDSHYGSMYASPPPWPPEGAPAAGHMPKRPSSWPTYVSLLVALLAIAVATAAWLRTPRIDTPPPKTFTTQEVQEAKTNVCQAYKKVQRLNAAVTTKDAGGDPATAFSIAINARLGAIAGSQYLKSALEPATPPELQAAIDKLSTTLYEMAIVQLGEAPAEETLPIAKEINAADAEVDRLCK